MNIHVGLVEDNIDPKRLGRIKVRVFGAYDQIPLEDLPWSSPFNQTDGKKFHVPAVGKLVSIVFIRNNLYSPYYLDAENYNINLKDRLDDMDDDNYVNFSAILYDHRTQVYSDNEEFKIDYYFNNIVIDKESVSIDLKDNYQKINIGDRKNADQQALFGNHWLNWFDKLVNELIKPTSLIGNYSAPILKPKLDGILSEYQQIRRTFISNNIFFVDNNKIVEDNNKQKRKYETKSYTHDVNLKLNDTNIVDTEIGETISCNSANEQNKINDLNTVDADPDDLNINMVSCTDQENSIRNEIEFQTDKGSKKRSDYTINKYHDTEYVDKEYIHAENELEKPDCEDFDFSNGINYNIRVSNNFTLGQLSLNALAGGHRLKSQKGLSKEQIACNLKNIATDVLDKIKNEYPNMMVTSGFRKGNGRSQHYKGEAIDIQFSNFTNKDYKDVAEWISNNVEYDQLLLEYKNNRSKRAWIHISYKKGNIRNQVLTLFNDSSRSPGGAGLIDLSGKHGIPV